MTLVYQLDAESVDDTGVLVRHSHLHLEQQFPIWGTGTPGGTPEVIQGVHEGLADVIMLSLCVAHVG